MIFIQGHVEFNRKRNILTNPWATRLCLADHQGSAGYLLHLKGPGYREEAVRSRGPVGMVRFDGELIPSLTHTDSFCCPVTPAAAMGFLMACLFCAGSLTCLWKATCVHFCPFEGISASSSLLTARPVSPYFSCVSLLHGVLSCCKLWGYLAAFPPIPSFSYFDHSEPVNISPPLPTCLPLNDNVMRGVSLL